MTAARAVQCPSCNEQNAAGSSFCGACGARLPSVCAACGANNPAGHKFCSECGAPHSLQNLCPAGLFAPHAAQTDGSLAPHAPQNELPAAFCSLQEGHCTARAAVMD